MEWRKSRESTNVVRDDGNTPVFGGGGMRRSLGGFRMNFKTIIVIVVVCLIFGINPLEMLGILSGQSVGVPSQYSQSSTPVTSNEPQVKFVRAILGSTEDVWGSYFQNMGQTYEEPKIDLFEGHVRSGCGAASAAMGPFYCSADHRIYLDLDFFREMETRFHASGDFARAYVIAHEVGHHVQELLGTMTQIGRFGGRSEGASGVSVRLELQADCYAGVWANRSEQQLSWLEAGDVDAALNAAHQIGDDMLQKRSQGYAVPDSFTHGTSEQRARWFKTGLASGDIRSCDTFKGAI